MLYRNYRKIKFHLLFQSFHAELHQYKHQMELFNQLTQSLIAMYQDDDTTRVKKMTEMINQRYNNLNTRYILIHNVFSYSFNVAANKKRNNKCIIYRGQ